MNINILDYIKSVRDFHPNAVNIFTAGSCYKFYLMLKERWPEAQAYHDMNHVITKIGDNYYDITGQVELGRHIPLNEEEETTYYKLSNNTSYIP